MSSDDNDNDDAEYNDEESVESGDDPQGEIAEEKPKGSYGGYRRGSGRPAGSKTESGKAQTAREKKAAKSEAQLKEITEALRDAGVDMEHSRFAQWGPIEVMQYTMQYYLAISQRANDPDTVLQNLSKAAAAARDLAPYVAPRLQSVDVNTTINRDPTSMSDAELLAIIQGGRRKG
jgi:hypothetical protein